MYAISHRSEDYQLLRDVVDKGLRELGYSMEDLSVELFASDKQQILDLYCSEGMNNSYKFFWEWLAVTQGSANLERCRPRLLMSVQGG